MAIWLKEQARKRLIEQMFNKLKQQILEQAFKERDGVLDSAITKLLSEKHLSEYQDMLTFIEQHFYKDTFIPIDIRTEQLGFLKNDFRDVSMVWTTNSTLSMRFYNRFVYPRGLKLSDLKNVNDSNKAYLMTRVAQLNNTSQVINDASLSVVQTNLYAQEVLNKMNSIGHNSSVPTYSAPGGTNTSPSRPDGSGCAFPLGHPDYCFSCGPCDEGEGGCHFDRQCKPGLVCDTIDYAISHGKNREDATFKCIRPSTATSITRPRSSKCKLPLGDPDYCAGCGPCKEGEGGCYFNTHCESGLVCDNIDYALQHGRSRTSATYKCIKPTPLQHDNKTCTLPLGHTDYCSSCGPCDEGEGGCSLNNHCKSGLVCNNLSYAEKHNIAPTYTCIHPITSEQARRE